MERLTIDEIIEHCDRKTGMYEKACDVKYLETAVMGNGIKEYWEHKQVAEYLRKLKDYEDLGYTPEELKVCFVGTPEVLYAIDNNREEGEKVYPIYPVDGKQIEYDKSGIYWNCRDDYGDYVTLPFSGLHYDYFVDRDEAEAKLKELRGGENESSN